MPAVTTTDTAPHLKVCCVASVAEAALAVAAGARALGLVSAMPSGPGVIDESVIAEVAAWAPPTVATFLLTCRQQADAIAEQHARCRTSALQLVDEVPEAELRRLRALCPGVKLVQVIHVVDESAVAQARAVAPWVDALLLDSGRPQAAVKELGGTGRVHDWTLSRAIREAVDRPVFLAGGLNADNVAQAVAQVRPFGLDVCSGVRTAGRLDTARLAALVRAAGA